jgi:hypothetical protein
VSDDKDETKNDSEEKRSAATNSVEVGENDHGSDPHEPEPPFEKDTPRMAVITAAYVAISLVVIVAVIGTREFFNKLVRDEKQTKVGDQVSSILTDLRKTEQENLGSYRWLDQGKGKVRIPADRATELVLAKYKATPIEVSAPPAPVPAATEAAPAGSADPAAVPSEAAPTEAGPSKDGEPAKEGEKAAADAKSADDKSEKSKGDESSDKKPTKKKQKKAE